MVKYELDMRGQLCPIPVIKTQQKIAELSSGDQLLVSCTDPGCLEDIPAWCRIHGHTVLEELEDREVISILVEVG